MSKGVKKQNSINILFFFTQKNKNDEYVKNKTRKNKTKKYLK